MLTVTPRVRHQARHDPATRKLLLELMLALTEDHSHRHLAASELADTLGYNPTDPAAPLSLAVA